MFNIPKNCIPNLTTMLKDQKKPLFRKVNTKAHGVYHDFGGDFSDSRNSKKERLETVKGSMHGKKQRGLDYTPLFKFLISKVGQDWTGIYAEAKSRIDTVDPIFWLVKAELNVDDECIRIGESSFYSGLFVDEENILRKINPNLTASEMSPSCPCCTHTFNGEVFGKGK